VYETDDEASLVAGIALSVSGMGFSVIGSPRYLCLNLIAFTGSNSNVIGLFGVGATSMGRQICSAEGFGALVR
jgi:hypothetical protein